MTTKSKQTIIHQSGDVAHVHITIKENDKWKILWVPFLKYTNGFNNDTHRYLKCVTEFLWASTYKVWATILGSFYHHVLAHVLGRGDKRSRR